ncbi:MAG: hypothetical protein QXW09_04350 [Thermoproteota archaeon]
MVKLKGPIIEIVKFELEKTWSAFFTGLILMLLILGGPGNSAPMFVTESLFEIASLGTGNFKPILLCLVTILVFANSFGRDIEQDVLMGEFTLPVRKETLFIAKLLTNSSVILLIDLIVTSSFIWIITTSIPLTLVALTVLVDAAILLLFIATTILMSMILRSRFGAIILSIAVYFLENILVYNISLAISTTNPPNLDPAYILLKLVFLGEITVFTWSIILIHITFPLALLVFAYSFFKGVLQLD